MSMKLSHFGNDDTDATTRLMSASRRLIDEAARLFPLASGQNERMVWLEAMIDEVPDYLYFKDRNSRFIVANRAIVNDNRHEGLDSLVGLSDFDIHPEHVARDFFNTEQEIIRTGRAMLDMEELVRDSSGNLKWLLTSKLPVRDAGGEVVGIVGIARDITGRKRSESLHLGQAHLLKMIALGAPLAEERAYSSLIDGVEIGPAAGSCGTAMWRGEPVIVSDIETDPLWADFKAIVAPYGYRACWSSPIRSYQGKVLGSFALYSRTPGEPSADCMKLVGMATHIAGIAIERKEAEDSIQFMAHHDTLTGLPNRSMLDERIASAIEAADECGGTLTLAFLDLDNFKLANDNPLRHASAARLKIVATRMTLSNGRIFAVEALIRWRHPERGLVAPGDFIPLAEETGLIGPIGDWTLREACRQNKAWQVSGLPPIVVSVNVSARQFQEKDWVERVAAALSESGLEARYLELELTESMIMEDVQQAVETMHRLERLGVHLAIDDFGTGYSSLASLKRFPVGRLKIDRSFVRDLPDDGDDAAIARAVISLAHSLHLRVIAEGVETREQIDFLREAGCDEIQGFYLSRPIDARALQAILCIPAL